MRYHTVFKAVAFVLCALLLTATLASAGAVIAISEAGLYTNTVEQLQAQQNEARLESFAGSLASAYAAEKLGNLEPKLYEQLYGNYQPGWLTGKWYYTVQDTDGKLLKTNVLSGEETQKFSYWVQSRYAVVLANTVAGEEPTMPQTTRPNSYNPTEPTMAYDVESRWNLVYEEAGVTYRYTLGDVYGPTYQITLYLTAGAVEQDSDWTWQLAALGEQHRYTAIWMLITSLVLFAVLLGYLCKAAGRKPGREEIRPGGLNKLPLDLYACLVIVCAALALLPVRWMLGEFRIENLYGIAAAFLGLAFGVCLAVVGFLFAFAAQVKTKGAYWWRRSITGTILRWIGKFLGMLPLTWQWLLGAAVLGGMLAFSLAIRAEGAMIFSVAACIAAIIYGASCFAKLMEGVRRMSQGDFSGKVSSVMMVGCFRKFAIDLNKLADGAVEAAKREMTSERMKAELVTNVSHDIKTPLTSIINYVDLLQKAENEQQRQQYLEVLSRQSQRMKKLIEDLVEMSKASSGAMACELARIDAAETVNQALGEFSDKLQQAGISPLVRYPQTQAVILADGRLTWRVLSNLLSNAVKYAMPGTRLYVDIFKHEGGISISLKNISREALPVAAEELMERFVRGDASRNTEGSGLGLNIARSLMELQHGRLDVMADGDLFKVTMTFPEAK